MKSISTTITILAIITLCFTENAQAQNGTEADIIFTQQKEEQAREQLKRILSEYDLDPWVFTEEVRIQAGVDPHSMPILTLNTNFLHDDKMQLEVFLHEQAHWFIFESEQRNAAIEALQELYPNPPVAANYRTYQHILVAWVALDAMTELFGKEEAREISKAVVQQVIGESVSEFDKSYRWYNERVFEETQAIGALMAEHNMIITPGQGIVVEVGTE